MGTTLALGAAEPGAGSPPSPLDEFSLEELGSVRVDTVEGASRYRQKVTDAPASVSIITDDDIRTYGWRTMAELLQAVRGQNIAYDRTYSYLGSRGFSRPGDYNARNLFLINGERFNDPIYDGAVIDDGFAVDLGLIERVEIIRGPTSSVYGSSAFFGVVNVVTRTGAEFAPLNGQPGGGGEVEIGGGSLGTARARVTGGGRTASRVEILVSATVSEREGNSTLYYPSYDNPPESDGIARDADGESTRSFFTSAAWRDFAFTSGFTSREKHIPTGSFGSILGDPRTAGIDETAWARLAFRRQLQPDLRLTASVSTIAYNYDGTYRFRAEDVDRTGAPATVKDYADARSYAFDTQITKIFRERHTFIAGFDYRDDHRQDQGNYVDDPVTTNFAGATSTTVTSPYLQGDFLLSRTVSATAGVRLDHYSTFGDSVNPRFGLIWHPQGGTTLKLLTGTAFRAPNPYEYSYNDGNRTFRANPALGPEEIRTTEFVWEQTVGRQSRLSVSAYQYNITDLIDLAIDPANGLLYFDNVASVRSRGVEAEFETVFANGWSARAAYALNTTQDRQTDRDLTRAPRASGTLHVSAPLGSWPLHAGFEVIYNSERSGADGTDIDPYALCNLTLRTPELPGGITLDLTVRNVFNTGYADPASDEHRQGQIPQDGRVLLGRATWRF